MLPEIVKKAERRTDAQFTGRFSRSRYFQKDRLRKKIFLFQIKTRTLRISNFDMCTQGNCALYFSDFSSSKEIFKYFQSETEFFNLACEGKTKINHVLL